MGAIPTKKKNSISNKVELRSSLVNERGFPEPLKTTCFSCKKKFFIKYNPGIGMPSQKNYWNYWVNDNWDYKEMRSKSEKERGKKWCDDCLKDFYLKSKKEFLNQVRDKSKRQTLRSYIYHKVI